MFRWIRSLHINTLRFLSRRFGAETQCWVRTSLAHLECHLVEYVLFYIYGYNGARDEKTKWRRRKFPSGISPE